MKRKFSRRANHATSMVKNLATSLLLYERMKTTGTKARAAQVHAEKLITMAKRHALTDNVGGKLALYRRMLAQTADELAAKKLVEVLAERFAKREGGYTRRIRLARRLGDNAEQMVVSLTELSAPTKADTTEAKAAVVAQKAAPKAKKPAKSSTKKAEEK